MASIDAIKNRITQSLAASGVTNLKTANRSDDWGTKYAISGDLPGGHISGLIVPPESAGFTFLTVYSEDSQLGQFAIFNGETLSRDISPAKYNFKDPYQHNPDLSAALVGFIETFRLTK